MVRRWLWLLPILALMLSLGAALRAQPATPAPANPLSALTPDQARAALDTLNDPKKRAAFTATLEALVRGQPPAAPAPAPPPDAAKPPSAESLTLQLAPNSLGAQLLLTVSRFLSDMADRLTDAVHAAQSLPLLWAWLVVMLTNPIGQRLLTDTGWRLGVVLVLSLGVAWSLRRVLRRPTARVLLPRRPREPAEIEEDAEARAERGETEPPPPPRRSVADGVVRRVVPGLCLFGLRIVPVIGLLITGHAAVATGLGGNQETRLVLLAVLDAVAASQTLLAVLGLLFQPDPPGVRLIPLRVSAAAYLMRWGKRLILIAVPGYTIGVVALLFGLSQPAHAALQNAVGLILTICAGIIVVQRRRSVRRWLMAPPESTSAMARPRNALARTWHWGALVLLAAVWLSWTLRGPDAMAGTLHYFVATAVVLLLATIARRALLAVLAPIEPAALAGDGTASPSSWSAHHRLAAYHGTLRGLIRFAIATATLLVLLQIYGIGGLDWLLTSATGHRLVSGLVTLLVTVALAFAVWEAINIAIQSHLETLKREAQAARSARLRTLLPLIRTTLAITVMVVAGLMILSEIGVDIGPLLAGAGIVGVAIGFGSQKLVQDVITGVFLLLENTMQVGDVVRVGDMSGAVESLSVRTIRLRTEDGSVAVIPFSAVTTVTNMTRDYSRAVVSLNVSIDQNVDAVIDTMRAIVTEMRAEETWSAIILDDLEVWGLDRFTETALQIKARIMCTPSGRWSVAREFNRRLKQRFKVVAIATPFSALSLPAPEATPTEVAPSFRSVGGDGSG
jgi:moderate conductance mechanosensitive channel